MTAFIELRPCDILATVYKTHPSQTSVSLTGALLADDADSIVESAYYRIETDADFSIGQRRDFSDPRGENLTGSWNLSGSIQLIRDPQLSNLEKSSVKRLLSVYSENNHIRPQSYSSSSVFSASTATDQYMTIVNIPQVLYGSEIKPGSLKLEIASSWTLTDDGYGGLLSGSTLVGSIFYQHGIVYIGHWSEAEEGTLNDVTMHFSGTETIPMTMYICTAPKGMMNYSNNSSFSVYNTASNRYEITTDKPRTYVTAVGLYDEDYRLLGIAKLARPILNEEDTAIQFKLKLHY